VAAWVRLSPHGLSFPGRLWNLDNFVDLKQIQTRYSASWLRIRRAQGPSRPSERTIKLATTHILFEILEILRARDEKQVANAILNSTSHWLWRNHGVFSTDVLESVDDFPSGLRIENRNGLFSLDRSPDGWFNQCWIIDRIMENGGFWTGTLEEHEPSLDADLASDEIEEPEPGPQTREAGMTPDGLLENKQRDQEKPRGHANWLMTSSMLSMLLKGVREGGHNEPGELNAPPREVETVDMHVFTAPQAMTSLAMALYKNKKESRHRPKRRAVFDVDGSADKKVQVLTPFNPVLESIPRPEIRSLAVSWIVEEVGNAAGEGVENAADKDGLERTFRVTGMAKGMWEFELTVNGRYNVM
jgi:hypothetical protein